MSQTPLSHRIEDACRRVGIGRTSLYDLIKRGEIRTIKISGRTLVPESELQRLVADKLDASKRDES